jgi:hypothetical protein
MGEDAHGPSITGRSPARLRPQVHTGRARLPATPPAGSARARRVPGVGPETAGRNGGAAS